MLDERGRGSDFDGETGGNFKGRRREDLRERLGGLIRFGLVGKENRCDANAEDRNNEGAQHLGYSCVLST